MTTRTHSTLRRANEARQAEWDKDAQITLSYRGNEMAGEVGEACNVIKKLDRDRLGIAGSRATVAQLAEELADVVICADLIAMAAGIDLDAAVADKFNATSEKVGLATRLILPKTDVEDFVYDPENWETTYDASDLCCVTEEMPVGGIMKVGRIKSLPTQFAAHVVTARDDDGDPEDWEVELFDTEAEALAVAAAAKDRLTAATNG